MKIKLAVETEPFGCFKPEKYETGALNPILRRYATQFFHEDMVQKLNETGEKNRIREAFKKLHLLIGIGIKDPLTYETEILAFLQIIDDSTSSSVFKALYRSKLIDDIYRQKKHRLEKQNLADIKKFIKLRNAIDYVANYQSSFKKDPNINIEVFRKEIQKLINIYIDNHTDNDTLVELSQIFTILTTQAIFELSKNSNKDEVVTFYQMIIDQIDFDKKMDTQIDIQIEMMNRTLQRF